MHSIKNTPIKENCNKELNKIEQRIQLLIEENQRLNQSLKNKMEEIQRLECENNNNIIELNKLRGIDCEQRIIKEIILSKTSECDKHKRQLNKAEKQIIELESEIQRLKAEKESFANQIKDIQNQHFQVDQDRLKQIDDLKQKVRKANSSSNEENEQLKLQIAHLQLENETQKSHIKSLSDENSSVKKHLGCLSGYIVENEQLRKENERLMEEIQSLITKQKCC